ncbi:MAG: SRPBCC family protein [Verrucomicrobia bacterium]|nr:SRPBCC family protein [Verrucomicrobiota bacterium]
MVKKVVLTFATIWAGFLIVVALQPSDFRIQRSATMQAPVAEVFAQVNDFHNWETWSPWAKLDPETKKAFEGAPAGIGAIHTWAGNKMVGEGRMTLTESRPGEYIQIKLEFLKPYEPTNTSEFSFKGAGGQTTVTWAMSGHNGFVSKAFCLFMDMDKIVGGDFEKGLAQLKAVVESQPRQ